MALLLLPCSRAAAAMQPRCCHCMQCSSVLHSAVQVTGSTVPHLTIPHLVSPHLTATKPDRTAPGLTTLERNKTWPYRTRGQRQPIIYTSMIPNQLTCREPATRTHSSC